MDFYRVQAMDIHTFGYETQNEDGSVSYVEWDVKDLWKAAKNKKPQMVDITLLLPQAKSVARYYDDEDEARIKEADLRYPVILSSGFRVLDGMHRIIKQDRMKRKSISCVILDRMPAPTKIEGKPFAIEGIPFTWSLEQSGIVQEIVIDEGIPDMVAFTQLMDQVVGDSFVSFVVPEGYEHMTQQQKIEALKQYFTVGEVGDMNRLVTYYDDGQLIGFSQPCDLSKDPLRCRLYKIDPADVYWKTGTIFIHPEHRNKGYASAILQQFIAFYGNVAWSAREDNIASQRVAERSGLVYSHDVYVIKNFTRSVLTLPPNAVPDAVYKLYKTSPIENAHRVSVFK